MSWIDSRPHDGALSGIRILDYTTAWAGTRMATYLAEMGAEVIHVESIQYLDTHRGWSKSAAGATGLFPNNEPGRRPWERNSQYNEFNKNKLGITLNLADPRGIDLFKRLAAISDVVIDNYKAGTTTRFGVGPEVLRSIREDLIVVSCPAFGTSGPYATYTAWGNQVVALTGHGLLLAYEGEEEPEPGNTYADPVAAVTGAFAVVAALLHRDRTGEGQYLEVALSDVLPGLVPEAILDYGLNGRIAQPIGNSNPTRAPWGVYPAAGTDQWVAICCQDDAAFLGLCAVMDRADLIADDRFATNAARLANRDALDAIIRDWSRTQNKHAAADALQAQGVAAEPAQSLPEVLAEPHLAQRAFFGILDHPDCGPFTYPLQPVQLSATPAVDYRPSPTYGQHNEVVLGGLLGLTADDLAELSRDLVIGDEPLDDDVRGR